MNAHEKHFLAEISNSSYTATSHTWVVGVIDSDPRSYRWVKILRAARLTISLRRGYSAQDHLFDRTLIAAEKLIRDTAAATENHWKNIALPQSNGMYVVEIVYDGRLTIPDDLSELAEIARANAQEVASKKDNISRGKKGAKKMEEKFSPVVAIATHKWMLSSDYRPGIYGLNIGRLVVGHCDNPTLFDSREIAAKEQARIISAIRSGDLLF